MPMPQGDASAYEHLVTAIRAHNASNGVDLDRFDDDQILRLRQYNLFPNTTVLVTADSRNVLVSRPGQAVARAELFTLHFDRLPPGAPWSKRPTDITNPLDAERMGLVFNQDVRIMSSLQRGTRQPGFTHTLGSSEERRIINTHRVMATYLDATASC